MKSQVILHIHSLKLFLLRKTRMHASCLIWRADFPAVTLSFPQKYILPTQSVQFQQRTKLDKNYLNIRDFAV